MIRWTEANKAVLLACKTDDELRAAFPETSIEGLKARQREVRRELGGSRTEILGKVADLLERNNIDLSDVALIKHIRVGGWDGLTRGEDGEPVVTPLETAEIVFTPTIAAGPAWPVIQQANPVSLPAPKPRRKRKHKWKTAVVLPDPQVGYRRDLDTGEFSPFHDEEAMATAIRAIELLEPDKIINLGDLLDLAEISRFAREPEFSYTTQHTLDRAYAFLAQQRAAAPHAEIVLLEGNHDARLPRYVLENAKAALRLRRADSIHEPPVNSVPFLLRLDELGIEYVAGYPAGLVWINERVACIHGSKVRSNGSTAAAVIDDERVSVLMGHVHRIELQHRTRRTRNGGRSTLAACLGCLCRVDGAVPSVKGATDPYGKPVEAVENWQRGFGVVTYQDGDGPFSLEIVPIHDEGALFRGSYV